MSAVLDCEIIYNVKYTRFPLYLQPFSLFFRQNACHVYRKKGTGLRPVTARLKSLSNGQFFSIIFNLYALSIEHNPGHPAVGI